jgi:hypothetical protein
MATAVDILVTVTQHGFFVKDDFASASSRGGTPRDSDDRDGGAGVPRHPSRLSLLSPDKPAAHAAPQPPPNQNHAAEGLPRAGDLRAAEHGHLTSGVKRLMKSVTGGLKAHQEPEAATEGLGGTYFFRDEHGRRVAIMKPCDEEPLAPNNPKGFVGRQLGDPGLKPTVRVGEAAAREVSRGLHCNALQYSTIDSQSGKRL